MLDSLCYRPLIKKRRYRISRGGLDWEIYEFFGDNAGLVVAEVKLESENQPFDRPDWLGRDVTGDPPLMQRQSRTESLLDLEGVSAANLAADNRQPMLNDGKQNHATHAFRSVTKLSARARGICLCQNRSARCPWTSRPVIPVVHRPTPAPIRDRPPVTCHQL